MELNLTQEVLLHFLGSIPIFASSYLYYRVYVIYPEKALRFFSLAWLFLSFWVLATSVSYLFLNPVIFLYKSIFIIASAICFELAISIISKGKIMIPRLGFVFVVSTMIAYFTYTNDGYERIINSGAVSYVLVGPLWNMVFIFTTYIVIVYGFYAYKIFQNSPSRLRHYAILNLIGAILFFPISAIFFFLSVENEIPRGIAQFIFGLGILVSTYGITRKPQLLYVLPFQTNKLIVIDQFTSTSLFSYSWVMDDTDHSDELLSTAFEGLTTFITNTMEKGRIKEINLVNSTIMTQTIPDLHVIVMLIATSPSYMLHSGLNHFCTRFAERYGTILPNLGVIVELTPFMDASELIEESFPYVPHYHT